LFISVAAAAPFYIIIFLTQPFHFNPYLFYFIILNYLQGFCCEIDEPCRKMRPYITVDNCLTFGHEYAQIDHNGSYWKEGSLARKTIYLEKQEEKKKKRDEEEKKKNDNE